MVRQSLPSLPLEILEEIVGFHREDVEGKPSTTLISCLSTSSQFRVCALRYLCAEVVVPLDWPHRVEQLRDCIVSAGVGPFIRSVVITCSSRPRYSPDQLDEDIISSLLHTISCKTFVQRLSLRGHRYRLSCYSYGQAFIWTHLPERTRHSLQLISQIPTLDHLSFHGLRDLPREIFSRHSSELVTFQSSQAPSKSLPEYSLNTISMSLIPTSLRNFRFPKLRSFDTTHTFLEEHDSGWKIIKDSCDTLETIRVRDAEKSGSSVPISFPRHLNIDMFPRLKEFVYSYHGCAWDQEAHILCRVLPFFKTSAVVSGLEVLKLDLNLDGMPAGNADDFWVGRSSSVSTDPSWSELDAILAKGCFPALTKVCISLSFRIGTLAYMEIHYEDFTIERVADKEALKHEVEDGLSKSFCASLKASVPLEIAVRMSF